MKAGPLLPRVEIDTATPTQMGVIEELLVARGKPGGRLANLYAMMVHQPEIARRFGATGAYLRFHASPPELVREAAILTACYVLAFDYETRAHEEIIQNRGMDRSAVLALAQQDWEKLPSEIALAARFVRAALGQHEMTDELTAELLDTIGVSGLLDLTAMAAHYSALSVFGRVLRPDADPPGMSLAKPRAETST